MLESNVAYLSMFMVKVQLKGVCVDKLKLTIRNLDRAFNYRCGCPIDKAVLYTYKNSQNLLKVSQTTSSFRAPRNLAFFGIDISCRAKAHLHVRFRRLLIGHDSFKSTRKHFRRQR
jgi:hypothetical protein